MLAFVIGIIYIWYLAKNLKNGKRLFWIIPVLGLGVSIATALIRRFTASDPHFVTWGILAFIYWLGVASLLAGTTRGMKILIERRQQ
jgi:hypothetical protein